MISTMNKAFCYVVMYGVLFQCQFLCICIVLTSCSHEGVHTAALNNGHTALMAGRHVCRPVTSQEYVIWLDRDSSLRVYMASRQ